jgi:hypothetical protein
MTYEQWRRAHPVLRKEADKLLAYVYDHPGEINKFDNKLVYTLASLGKIEKVKDHDGIRVRLYSIPRRPTTDEELDEIANLGDKILTEYRGYSIELDADGLYDVKRFGVSESPSSPSFEEAKKKVDALLDWEREKRQRKESRAAHKQAKMTNLILIKNRKLAALGLGGFRLVTLVKKTIVAGACYELSAREVSVFCKISRWVRKSYDDREKPQLEKPHPLFPSDRHPDVYNDVVQWAIKECGGTAPDWLNALLKYYDTHSGQKHDQTTAADYWREYLPDLDRVGEEWKDL